MNENKSSTSYPYEVSADLDSSYLVRGGGGDDGGWVVVGRWLWVWVVGCPLCNFCILYI